MPGRKSNVKNLTEREYESIKVLAETGIKPSVIKNVMNRSYSTIEVVKKSKDFEDYKAIQNANWNRYNKRMKANAHKVDVSKFQGETTPIPETQTTEIIHQLVTEILIKVDAMQDQVNKLVEAEEARESSEKVNRWKFGGSR